MISMDHIFTLLWTSLDLTAFYLFFDAFLIRRLAGKKRLAVWAGCWILTVLFGVLEIPGVIRLPVCMLIVWAASVWLYQGNPIRHMLITLLAYLLFSVLDGLMMYAGAAILGVSFNELVWRKVTYLLLATTEKLLAVWIGWFLKRFRKPSGVHMPGGWICILMMFPAVSLLMIAVAMAAFRDEPDMSVGVAVLFGVLGAANCGLMYLEEQLEKGIREKQESLLLRQQMQLQADGIVSLEEAYRTQRRITHDFNHHLDVLSGLLEENQVDALSSYIQELRNHQRNHVLAVNSRHPIIDAILNQKYSAAVGKNIDMQICVNDLSGVDIPIEALVVLLSNLLDNAIEACGTLADNRQIICSVLLEESLFLSVRNTTAPVEIHGDTIQSTKQSKLEHGYGLANIQRILRQLDSEFTFTYQEGWFEFAAEIPIRVLVGQ